MLRICCYTDVCLLFLLLYVEMYRNRWLRRSQEALQEKVIFLDLCVNGSFSARGAYLLEKGILRNRSLSNIKVSFNGEPPEN